MEYTLKHYIQFPSSCQPFEWHSIYLSILFIPAAFHKTLYEMSSLMLEGYTKIYLHGILFEELGQLTQVPNVMR